MTIEKITGAGVVPIFDNRLGKFSDLKKDILYLVLHDLKGKYDFPKGTVDIEYNESPYECALREMFEESNLSLDDFKDNKLSGNSTDSGFICGDGLLMFFGVLENIANIKLKPNPELQRTRQIDFYEHKGISFVTYEEALAYPLVDFLIPAIEEARIWFNKII